jgi:hypothetical protein
MSWIIVADDYDTFAVSVSKLRSVEIGSRNKNQVVLYYSNDHGDFRRLEYSSPAIAAAKLAEIVQSLNAVEKKN